MRIGTNFFFNLVAVSKLSGYFHKDCNLKIDLFGLASMDLDPLQNRFAPLVNVAYLI